MEVRLHDSVADFRRVAGDLYRCGPVEAAVEFMGLCGAEGDSNALLATVWEGGAVVGAAFQTSRSPLLCGGLPDAAVDVVVAEIACVRTNLNAVYGPSGIVTKFAAAWLAATGALGIRRTQERLYRLDRLHPPTSVAGEPRPANHGDTGLIVDWLYRFHAETEGVVAQRAANSLPVRTAQESPAEVLLWTVDSDPVSMAGPRSSAAGVARIGPVYTPADRRGHGYAAAVTAAAAARALEAGAHEVVLFTDLTDPVPNAIYQRIGFRPVSDLVRIDFSGPSSGEESD